jgi:hypothetical protein
MITGLNAMRVRVTQQDIDNGKKGNCYECPIAQAVERDHGFTVSVSMCGIRILKNSFLFDLPDEAKDFLHAFDCGLGAQPIEFDAIPVMPTSWHPLWRGKPMGEVDAYEALANIYRDDGHDDVLCLEYGICKSDRKYFLGAVY